jgi:hypothetical protein
MTDDTPTVINPEVITTGGSTIEEWADNRDFWRNKGDDGQWLTGNCYICGDPVEWVYLDIGWQHLDCDEYPSTTGDDAKPAVRIVRGNIVKPHNHKWEHFGVQDADIPSTERRCAICSTWQHVGLKGPKITWLEGRA